MVAAVLKMVGQPKITAIPLTIALPAGCGAAPTTAREDTPDIDAIVQRPAAEAIAHYE